MVSWHGQRSETLLSPNERGGTDFQVIIGGEEITDLAIGHTQAMFELSGHGQDDRTKAIAGSADGIRGLLGMPPLTVLVTAGAIAGLDIELSDDRHHWRQIRLELCDHPAIVQRRMTVRAFRQGHRNDAVGYWSGTHCGGMAKLSARSLAAFLQVAPAKAIGLARLLIAGRIQLPPQALTLG